MKVNNHEAIEKLDVESLIVDLLACGLGGCVILFFIFSINIIGNAAGKGATATNSNKVGHFSAIAAMIGDDGKTKSLGALRIVRITNLSPENLKAIHENTSSAEDFWKLSAFTDQNLLESVKFQVKDEPGGISFILVADGMKPLSFEFPANLKEKLTDQVDNKPSIEAMVVEGSSQREDFTGIYTTPSKEISSFNKFKVCMDVGRLTEIEKLIKVQPH